MKKKPKRLICEMVNGVKIRKQFKHKREKKIRCPRCYNRDGDKICKRRYDYLECEVCGYIDDILKWEDVHSL